jgi:hypothetical protein
METARLTRPDVAQPGSPAWPEPVEGICLERFRIYRMYELALIELHDFRMLCSKTGLQVLRGALSAPVGMPPLGGPRKERP